MAATRLKRPCRFCRKWFAPDVRLADRQIACGAAPCRKKRKAAAQAAWIAAHPHYFRGRAEKHRQWRREHKEAQRQRRAGDPALRERERLAQAKRRKVAATCRVVEQDARTLQLVVPHGDSGRLHPVVEQDAIRAGILVVVGLASRHAPVVEQGPIPGALQAWHDLGRRALGGIYAETRAP